MGFLFVACLHSLPVEIVWNSVANYRNTPFTNCYMLHLESVTNTQPDLEYVVVSQSILIKEYRVKWEAHFKPGATELIMSTCRPCMLTSFPMLTKCRDFFFVFVNIFRPNLKRRNQKQN